MPAPKMLVSVNEKEEREAQKSFYQKVESEMSFKRIEKLKFWHRVSIFYTPLSVSTFMIVYWVAGLKHAEIL